MELTSNPTWHDPVYQQTVATILGFLFVGGLIVFFLRNKNFYFITAWASIKSWLLAAPIFLGLIGLGSPWPTLILTALALMGAKAFFQVMGMYHRSYFVIICYLGIMGLAWASFTNQRELYNALPMLVLGACCLVPLLRNSYKRMIQYICLTLLGFILLGWCFMHLALLIHLPNGVYQIIYIILLTEFCDNTNLATSRYFRKYILFSKIDRRRTLGSFSISVCLTLGLAFLMRQLLPGQSDEYWLAAGLVASLVGILGDLLMDVIRRDAGVKIVGPFILGRGDFLQRIDRLIFVAPIYDIVMRTVNAVMHP